MCPLWGTLCCVASFMPRRGQVRSPILPASSLGGSDGSVS